MCGCAAEFYARLRMVDVDCDFKTSLLVHIVIIVLKFIEVFQSPCSFYCWEYAIPVSGVVCFSMQ